MRLLAEHLNTVRDIAKYNSQANTTTMVNHLVYDAFGTVTSESNPAVDSLFLFTARPYDPDSQLQNNLNRWYDARVGRWLSEDPIGFAAGDGNLYRYVGNNILLAIDPLGMDICDDNLRKCLAGASSRRWACQVRAGIFCSWVCRLRFGVQGQAAVQNCVVACVAAYSWACEKDYWTLANKCYAAFDICKNNNCQWPRSLSFWGWNWGDCEVCW